VLMWLGEINIDKKIEAIKIEVEWSSWRLIGSPRQRSRVQDPFSTINIHEDSHWIFRTLHVVGFSCTNESCWIPLCKRR
jgi:hypothetical protein